MHSKKLLIIVVVLARDLKKMVTQLENGHTLIDLTRGHHNVGMSAKSQVYSTKNKIKY